MSDGACKEAKPRNGTHDALVLLINADNFELLDYLEALVVEQCDELQIVKHKNLEGRGVQMHVQLGADVSMKFGVKDLQSYCPGKVLAMSL